MKFDNKYAIKNPFKYFRHEIPNINVRFGFSTNDLVLRTNRDEAGWDDITEMVPTSMLPEVNQTRLKPFLQSVDEQFYLENCNIIDYRDCIVTQEWAKKPSDETALYNMLNKEKGEEFPEKFTKEFFLGVFFNEKYFHITKDSISFNDVESFTLKFFFMHDMYEDEVELTVEDIIWKEPAAIKHVLKDDDPYPNTVYVDERVFKYYFNICFNSSKRLVVQLLQQEYLLTPAMILDCDLYELVKDKITVEYEAVSHF